MKTILITLLLGLSVNALGRSNGDCYLDRYPDICSSSSKYCTNPAAHFNDHGNGEGRVWGCIDNDNNRPGRGDHDRPGRGDDFGRPGRGDHDRPGRGDDFDRPGRGDNDRPGRGDDFGRPGRGDHDRPGRGDDFGRPGRGDHGRPGRSQSQCYLDRYPDICANSYKYCADPERHFSEHGAREERVWGCGGN